MKFLHLFGPDTKNSYGILSQLHKKFDSNQHKYLILSYDEARNRFPKLKEFDDLNFVPERRSRLYRIYFLLKMLFKHDVLVWHSLYFTTQKFVWFLYLFRWFLRKSIWIEWGADLYLWQFPETNYKKKIRNFMNGAIRRSFRYIGCSFECDNVEVERQFGKGKKCFYTPLPNPMKEADGLIKLIENARPEILEEKRSVKVQIAHNSFSFNNHMKLIDYVKRFKDENIHYIVPLTYGVYGVNGQYGGIKYRNTVIKYARINLTKKVTILERNIPFEKYIKFLWDIDIAIFDFDRPCALGTLRILLLMGKKVYLPSGTPYYDYLISKGLPICDTNLIPSMTYEEFIEPVDYPNKDWIYSYLNNDLVMKNWENMFNYFKEKR